jgi:hypothetical protein
MEPGAMLKFLDANEVYIIADGVDLLGSRIFTG